MLGTGLSEGKLNMKMRRIVILLLAAPALSLFARAQTLADGSDSVSTVAVITPAPSDRTYIPRQRK